MIYIVKDLDAYNARNDYSIFIKQYFSDIIKYGTKKYIENIDVEVKILDVNGTLIPITFGNNKKDSCFSSSILGMFDYLLHESVNINNFLLRNIVKIFAYIVSFLIKKINLDLVIFVNNNLLSTNIYPNLSEKDFQEIKIFLLKNYPKYAIIFRTINATNTNFLKDLGSIGFKRIIFRQIFISYSNKINNYLKLRDNKRDKNLYNKSGYSTIISDIYNHSELKEIKECYDNLYLEKYSLLNPRLTIDFFENIQKNDYFYINSLKNNIGEINATYGYFMLNNQTTAPVFGYKKENLYRHLTHSYIFSILNKTGLLNWSSGVGKFKMHRGAEKETEFFLLYYDNLGILQRIVWWVIFKFSKLIGEKYFKNIVI